MISLSRVAPLAAEYYDIKQVLKDWRIIICPIHKILPEIKTNIYFLPLKVEIT